MHDVSGGAGLSLFTNKTTVPISRGTCPRCLTGAKGEVRKHRSPAPPETSHTAQPRLELSGRDLGTAHGTFLIGRTEGRVGALAHQAGEFHFLSLPPASAFRGGARGATARPSASQSRLPLARVGGFEGGGRAHKTALKSLQR